MFDQVVGTSRTFLANYNFLEQSEDIFYWTFYNSVKNFFKTYLRLKITGQENTPHHGPLIVASNHSSFVDPIIVSASVYRQIHWMSKIENFEFPIIKSIFSMWSAFPVQRGKSDKKALQTAISYLKAGKCVGIFPEGTRTPTVKVGRLHKGAARLAVLTGASILPVMLVGTYKMLKKGEMFMKPVKVTVTIGKPIETAHLKGLEDDWDVIEGITNDLQAVMNSLVPDNVD